MSEELRKQHRAISYDTTNNTIYNNGIVHGNITSTNNGTMIANVTTEDNNTEVLKQEFENAKNIIKRFDDGISEVQKQRLLEILEESKRAVDSNLDVEQKRVKKSFKDAICFMGNVGVKLISALSGLANLFKFFGLNHIKE